MNCRGIILAISLLATCCVRPVSGADTATRSSPSEVGTDVEQPAQPLLPSDATWAGVMIIIIGGLILAAACIGPIVRVNLPEEVPPTQSHDEPPGSSRQRG